MRFYNTEFFLEKDVRLKAHIYRIGNDKEDEASSHVLSINTSDNQYHSPSIIFFLKDLQSAYSLADSLHTAISEIFKEGQNA